MATRKRNQTTDTPDAVAPEVPESVAPPIPAADAAPPAGPTPNETRQCQDAGTPWFGAVAVRSDLPAFAWGVMHPTNGGHWEGNDDMVADWKVIS